MSEPERLPPTLATKGTALHYGEPPDWLLPVRETLGSVLLQNGAAAEAEKVFRADLERNPQRALAVRPGSQPESPEEGVRRAAGAVGVSAGLEAGRSAFA